MQELDDIGLLREYVKRGSEEAFATLVERHVNKVYSVTLRHTGNPHQAEEITQAVFIILARKSQQLSRGVVLYSWLYKTARLASMAFIRGEIRRTRREQEAFMQNALNETKEPEVWPQIAPLLDAALAALNETDRRALVLRFFYGKSMKEIGADLGANEDTTKQRVNRALEKLQTYFQKRGVHSTTAMLAGTISACSVQVAPVALAKSITAVALTKGATASTSTLTLIKGALKIMAWTKAKTVIVVGAGVLFAAGTTTVTVKEIHRQRPYSWQVRTFDSRVLKREPPQVRIVPTRFPDSASWGSSDGQLLGSGASLKDILRTVYGMSSARTVVSTELPAGRYDYIANLPRGSAEALQEELKSKFGVVGRRERLETNVVRLTLKYRNAQGLRPSATNRNSSLSNEVNHFSCVNLPLTGLVDYLEYYLGIPVVDQTGLAGRFDIDLKLDEQDVLQHDPEALKQVLLDQLGLELVPSREPVEMLVVEKAN
jgi:uncharacterized protein (TIGR03435 family)